MSVSLPDPAPQSETFKKKDVVEILSHKKAYNACKYESGEREEDATLFQAVLHCTSDLMLLF